MTRRSVLLGLLASPFLALVDLRAKHESVTDMLGRHWLGFYKRHGKMPTHIAMSPALMFQFEVELAERHYATRILGKQQEPQAIKTMMFKSCIIYGTNRYKGRDFAMFRMDDNPFMPDSYKLKTS